MTEVIKRKKALSVSPLKASQTVGASLAFLGFSRAMPIMHGSQGCTAFAKVFFVRHFREPIPLQTTAMDQVSSVMGADENIVEALKNICEKNSPSILGMVTTGLAETQGADVHGSVKRFKAKYPQFENNHVVSVNTPDFTGSFESGFALALKAILETLIPQTYFPANGDEPERTRAGVRKKQVNVLCHANLTPGDLEYIVESIESFGLRAMLIPDLSGSLDGHLSDEAYNPLTTGGLSVADLQTAGESAATLVVGDSIKAAGKVMLERTGVPSHHFPHLMTLEAVDQWLATLSEISGQGVAVKWQRQRQQLQDAMLDTHFMIGTTRVGIAADPDLVTAFDALMTAMGAEMSAVVIPAKTKTMGKLSVDSVQVGDLEDLENIGKEKGVDMLIGNSHASASAERLHVPLLRVGFPQYDLLGGFQRCWFGYRGIQNTLFDIANMKLAHHQDIQPYHSVYSQKPEAQAIYQNLGERGPNVWGGH
ncbi:nitrogenase iron-molybdenum cofactor biosynthesis protein NifN [Halioxenophilus sp. WMMB6]|uniref:nitrogenase iron-molybdenum cofactor biosynthesis protein NifN n=1 Tax=Halioxenophilus sp. WMMB6 TaxID=3073815 RepID=UPI00295E9F6B|nr:nitrogenase iron-molybdenum cofactor biosynthesis protein NifN [Halioxenophilus sp. WMMB6]